MTSSPRMRKLTSSAKLRWKSIFLIYRKSQTPKRSAHSALLKKRKLASPRFAFKSSPSLSKLKGSAMLRWKRKFSISRKSLRPRRSAQSTSVMKRKIKRPLLVLKSMLPSPLLMRSTLSRSARSWIRPAFTMNVSKKFLVIRPRRTLRSLSPAALWSWNARTKLMRSVKCALPKFVSLVFRATCPRIASLWAPPRRLQRSLMTAEKRPSCLSPESRELLRSCAWLV